MIKTSASDTPFHYVLFGSIFDLRLMAVNPSHVSAVWMIKATPQIPEHVVISLGPEDELHVTGTFEEVVAKLEGRA